MQVQVRCIAAAGLLTLLKGGHGGEEDTGLRKEDVGDGSESRSGS